MHSDALDREEKNSFAQHDPKTATSENLPGAGRRSFASSASTTSLVFEHMSDKTALQAREAHRGGPDDPLRDDAGIEEESLLWRQSRNKIPDMRLRRILYILIAIGAVGWVAALFMFLGQDRQIPHSARPHDPHATHTIGNGKKVTLESVLEGEWYPKSHAIRWIAGPQGEDGLLLERGGQDGRNYLVVEDVRYRGSDLAVQKEYANVLMKSGQFQVGEDLVFVSEATPNANHTKVLIQSNRQNNWRHSTTGSFWIFDVESQTGEPLDSANVHGRIQLASWSPKGDAIVFTRDNNMFLRRLDSSSVSRITTDGGSELFYGIPDWVYEEEVLAGASATWWSGDGKFVAFLRTDESQVPNFPVQYFFSRPSGQKPKNGEETYPETLELKYPKAGAPMSVVSLLIYDVAKNEIFSPPVSHDFPDDDRLITEVVWAGTTGQLIMRSTNRESDVLKVILIDANERSGKVIREQDVQKLDGGWFEVTHSTVFVPADPSAGRPHDGYIDTVIESNNDHLAYFTPIDNATPIMLTAGDFEVVNAPSAVDLHTNLVYFISTQEGSTQRHLYSVDMTKGPSSVESVTDDSQIGYYSASFSAEQKYMLLSYQGPDIPWQKVLSTPGNRENPLEIDIEKNELLNELAKKTELPIKIYQTINVDGFELDVVERRPPHFDERKRYPVLFHLYNGPVSQYVDRRFTVDFQSYVASSLGYIVVTLDGRGTGFRGRKHRCIIRGNLGHWEAHDQIAAAKLWAAKDYVDSNRIAIWGWSYGGFMTLKTLETDAGETFKYGMAVAPVTDWRFYDSVYTERYMHTPQHNPTGYNNASISHMEGLAANVRFLVMHGASDDNVHFQNTLQLLDRLDLANVRNYDVHVFPDSNHGIYFHNANQVVYEKLRDWLVNAFNGEWLRLDDPDPVPLISV